MAAQVEPEGTGVILGRVVDATTGQPIPEAVLTVSTSPAAGRGAGAGRGATPPADVAALLARGRGVLPTTVHVIAGGDGQFVFTGLDAGNVTIRAQAPGYLDGTVGQGRPTGLPRPVALAEGERRGGVILRLWPYASIEGRIVDEAGEPAVEANVRAYRIDASLTGITFERAGTARTDDRGMYRFGELAPGRYVVSVPYTVLTLPATTTQQLLSDLMGSGSLDSIREMADAGGPPMDPSGMRVGDLTVSAPGGVRLPAPRDDGRLLVYRPLFFPAAASIADASILTLAAGDQRAGVDLALQLVESHRVTGVVTGADGPVRNLAVHLESTDTGEADGLPTSDAATSRTGADGRFTFLGVPPGAYRLRATREPPRALPEELQTNPMLKALFGARPGEAARPPRHAEMSLQVGNGDVDGLRLMLEDGPTIGGRVEFRGSTTPPAAKQVSILVAPLVPGGGRSVGAPVNPADDLSFTTPGHVPGRYTLSVFAAAPRWTVESIHAGGADVTWSPFDLDTTPITDVVVTMTDGAGRVSGSVRGADGPAGTATVLIAPADFASHLAKGLHPNLIRQRPASPTGAYEIAGLTPGEYLIVAIDDADVDTAGPEFLRSVVAGATRIRIGPGEARTMDLSLTTVRR
ncbi:MAG: carboxypeptidase-like regulatory domain-containing protein [Vicinamibacterales bacterium]